MTFNSSQQERLLAALERIADALEAAAKPVQPTAIIRSDRPVTEAEAERLRDALIKARDAGKRNERPLPVTTDGEIPPGTVFTPRFESSDARTLRILEHVGSNRYLTQSLGTGRRRETSLATLRGYYIEAPTPDESDHTMSAFSSDALRIEALHAALGTTQPTASGAVNVTDVVKNAETYLAFLVGEAAK